MNVHICGMYLEVNYLYDWLTVIFVPCIGYFTDVFHTQCLKERSATNRQGPWGLKLNAWCEAYAFLKWIAQLTRNSKYQNIWLQYYSNQIVFLSNFSIWCTIILILFHLFELENKKNRPLFLGINLCVSVWSRHFSEVQGFIHEAITPCFTSLRCFRQRSDDFY